MRALKAIGQGLLSIRLFPVGATPYIKPDLPEDDIAQDWKAVGNDMKYGEKENE